jgi:hypothetical protein
MNDFPSAQPGAISNTVIAEFLKNYFGDKRGIIYPYALNKLEVDLDNELVDKELPFVGDFLYADRDTSSGAVAYVKFNNPAMPGFPYTQNTGLTNFPFNKVLVSCAAQPGKSIIFWYGYGVAINPPNQDISQILSTVQTQDYGDDYGTAYAASVALAGGVPIAMLSPGSNVAGVVLKDARHGATLGAGVYNYATSLLANSIPPGAQADGDLMLSNRVAFADAGSTIMRPIQTSRVARISTGKGLYWIATNTELSTVRGARYTVL